MSFPVGEWPFSIQTPNLVPTPVPKQDKTELPSPYKLLIQQSKAEIKWRELLITLNKEYISSNNSLLKEISKHSYEFPDWIEFLICTLHNNLLAVHEIQKAEKKIQQLYDKINTYENKQKTAY